MNKISQAAKVRACELANAECESKDWEPSDIGDRRFGAINALARVLQEHSDVAKDVDARCAVLSWWSRSTPIADVGIHKTSLMRQAVQSLILPDDPVDPLEEIVRDVANEVGITGASTAHTVHADRFRAALRAALERHGLQITAKE